MRGVLMFLVVALLAAGPAAAVPDASPLDPVLSESPRVTLGDRAFAADSAAEPRASCAVTAVDDGGSGVQPFLDPAAVGARVGTELASVTLAVYPYSCTYVVFQLANPNQPLPREPLPEDTPYREILAPLFEENVAPLLP